MPSLPTFLATLTLGQVKNCTEQFDTTLQNPNCRLFGNVTVGIDLTVGLQLHAHVYLVAYDGLCALGCVCWAVHASLRMLGHACLAAYARSCTLGVLLTARL